MVKMLNFIDKPSDIKKMSIEELKKLSSDMREFIIENIVKNGGHLGSALGVIELTIALHYIFDSPNDKIIWDIGHQSYAHKILTGRRESFKNIHQKDAISGFCKISESEHDFFGAGHSSTSLAVMLGAIRAAKILGGKEEVIGIIGDSAIAAGMAFESLNNIKPTEERSFIIVNDNDTSISAALGNLREHFTKLKTNKLENKNIKKIVSDISERKQNTENNIFTNLGYGYIGVADGHDLELLINLFKELKESDLKSSVVIHIETEKGKGYPPAKNSPDKMHKINPASSVEKDKSISNYTTCFANTLMEAMKTDKKIVGVSAAMTFGTGLIIPEREFEDRIFDVGISEQCAVTFAASMARSGLKPFCAIYSTFLQRGYDQIIHDVALQSLPVRFAIDRAGFVGTDGPTHNGSFDIAFLRIIPNIVIMSPSNETEMIQMIKTAIEINDRPTAIRYSKYGQIAQTSEKDFKDIKSIEIGKSKTVQKGEECCIICFGHVLEYAVKAGKILQDNEGIKPTIINAMFAKPIDEKKILEISKSHRLIITVEDGSIGGFGSAVLEFLARVCYKGKFVQITQPDCFIDHGSISSMHELSGISTENIVKTINECLKEVIKDS